MISKKSTKNKSVFTIPRRLLSPIGDFLTSQLKRLEFRKSALIERDPFGFVTVNGFGKFRFGRNLDKISGGEGNLYISTPSYDISKKSKILKNFYLLNGEPILKVYTKPYLL